MARENSAFSQVPVADIQRSKFNRSHGHKTTFYAGELIPFYVDEALPGDTFEVDVTAFARLATPVVPVMDNMYLDFFFFSVPNRLLWSKWQRFMGEQENPGDSIDFLMPQVTAPAGTGFLTGTIGDYFGLPIGPSAASLSVSALPFRAYNRIWNEWFRDENLQTRIVQDTGDGPESGSSYLIKRRGKRHDYFTSCLPWPQKGVAAQIPLGTTAPVLSSGTAPQFTGLGGLVFPTSPMRVTVGAAPRPVEINATATIATGNIAFASGAGNTGLYTDLSTATAATINSLRQAFQIQKLLERDARGGTRYIELLKAHFGVTSPDARMQRAEFLGGGTVPVIINPVAQTSSTGITGSAGPQGNLAAYGIAGGGDKVGFTKSFVEHCTLIGLVCARADLNYYQGVSRPWSRRTRYDFYWPAFAHLGEQAVLNKEIYFSGVPATDDAAFGYQERWAEYKYFPNRITGQYRPNAAAAIAQWHLAQTFGSLPVLNSTFIEENPPMTRIKAVTTQPDFLFDSHIRIGCTRPMPVFSTPGMLDHF